MRFILATFLMASCTTSILEQPMEPVELEDKIENNIITPKIWTFCEKICKNMTYLKYNPDEDTLTCQCKHGLSAIINFKDSK